MKKAQSEGHSISAENQAEFRKIQEGVQKQVLERYVQFKALKERPVGSAEREVYKFFKWILLDYWRLIV